MCSLRPRRRQRKPWVWIVRLGGKDLRMNARSAAILATGCALLAGCGGGGNSAATTTTAATTATQPPATTTQAPATTTQPPSGIDTMPTARTNPVSVHATNKSTALLTAVRAARHEGYDRLVFEFANALPGYDVRYVQAPIHQDGSGAVVPVKGSFFLRVRMENALDADLTKPSAPATYTGPRRFDPGTPEIAELARSGGFEAILTWIAGLRDHVDFRVTALQSPPRLAVDVRNH
jgi:hypothetical protein